MLLRIAFILGLLAAPILGIASEEKAQPIALTKPPQLLEFVQAPYPEAALKEKRESVVLMALDVDAEGIVQRVELIQSGGREFDQAAMAAAAGFKFVPAEAGELGPVPVRITYRYQFVFEEPPEETRTATATGPQKIEPINFKGVIREAGSRLPLNLATIHLIPTSTAFVKTSTESDARGRFAFRGIPAGQYDIEVVAPFFTKLKVTEEIRAQEELEVVYFTRRKLKNPYEIVVRAEAPRKEVARRTIKLEEVQRVPGSQGDAIRVIQNMPGVARSPFGVGVLVVRGAPPQDTGVFLDGQRIPTLFHFGGLGGLTSVINASTLDEINFMPGGYGPQYGLISAGAIELKTRAPKTDRVHGEAKLDLLTVIPANVSVMVEGPATDDPKDGSFLFSIRRSAIDGVFAAATEIFDISATLAPRFYDYSLRYDIPVGGDKKRSLTLFTYGSDDELILAGNTGDGDGGSVESRTQFHRFNPRYTYRPDEDTFLQISPILGVDMTETAAPSTDRTDSFKLEARAWSGGVLVHGGTKLAPWLRLMAGGDLYYFGFEVDSVLPGFSTISRFPGPNQGPPPTRRDQVLLPIIASSLFAEFEVEPFEGLTLWPGVRLQVLDYEAEDQPLIDPRLVEGRTLVEADPRFTIRYQALDRLSLKGQIGKYSQPAFPPQFYFNADLPFQKSEQYSGGLDLDIIDRLTLDLQGFYRFAYNIGQATPDVEVVDGSLRPVGYRATGARRAYGMEMFLRLENRWDVFGWIAYTLSRAEYRNRFGQWRQSFVTDQTHNLNVVGVYEFAFNWYAGVRFRYVTGGGLPKTVQRWYDSDEDGYDRVIDGNVRAPPFHQLDLYVEKRWVFEQWYLELYVDIQNVYNKNNTEFYRPSFDFKDEIPVPGLPILPSFGLKGVF